MQYESLPGALASAPWFAEKPTYEARLCWRPGQLGGEVSGPWGLICLWIGHTLIPATCLLASAVRAPQHPAEPGKYRPLRVANNGGAERLSRPRPNSELNPGLP